NFSANGCIIQLVEGDMVSGSTGVFGKVTNTAWLADDPLTKVAIANRCLQFCGDVAANPDLTAVNVYQTENIQAHLVTPILYRGSVLGVLSLQWQQTYEPDQATLDVIHLCAQQSALAIVCARGVT
ncbi:MAG: GAF domain-containing protein, partial [Cyanobacteria bacterium]|nr:GAF domain-containing protein [Cyanobacteriota bacterium]MDW8200953.1 GAF domain-containing protein [Cyanobacteriota bacterium SKYGB_h_bin112]